MTDAERIYARAASPMWAEKIRTLAEAHHVSPRMEATACVRAALELLYAEGLDEFDVANLVAECAPVTPEERTAS
jgi:hypothetical protein